MPTCDYCGLMVTDGREESGWTGEGPDWMADGDFGCDASPEALPAPFNSGAHAVDGVGPGVPWTADTLRDFIRGEALMETDLTHASESELRRLVDALAPIVYREEMGVPV